MAVVRPGAAARACAAAALALVLGATAVGAAGAAARPAVDRAVDPAAAAAARWQAGELADGAIPGLGSGPDWGLTIDTLIALEATGVDPAAAARTTEQLALHVRDYNSLDEWAEPGQRIAGATAKLLYAAVVTDSDPSAFGEFDLRQETLDLIAGPEAGAEHGRIKDKVLPPARDNSNTFAQSLAVLGLARSGELPQSAVDFLVDQQCAAGGFRLYPYAFGGPGEVTGDCDAQGEGVVLDPDSTGMAVQALYAAAEAGATGAAAAADRGVGWLRELQGEDGSFGGSGPTSAPNTNSTGLAGQALAAGGEQDAAERAAEWVRAHQLTAADGGAAAGEAGAVAYNGESLAAARADGIADFQRDQWRRATPQALLVLAGTPLGEIGTTDPDPDPGPDPGPGPTNGGTAAGSSAGGATSGGGSGSPGGGTAGGTGGSGGTSGGGSGDGGGSGGGGTGAGGPGAGAVGGVAGGAGGVGGAGDVGGKGPDGGSGGSLAATGVSVLPYAGGAFVLVLLGLVVHGTARRRGDGSREARA